MTYYSFWNCDWLKVLNSSSYSLWAIRCEICELPAYISFKNIVLVSVWFGKEKSEMSFFSQALSRWNWKNQQARDVHKTPLMCQGFQGLWKLHIIGSKQQSARNWQLCDCVPVLHNILPAKNLQTAGAVWPHFFPFCKRKWWMWVISQHPKVLMLQKTKNIIHFLSFILRLPHFSCPLSYIRKQIVCGLVRKGVRCTWNNATQTKYIFQSF